MHICVTWPQWVNTLRQRQNGSWHFQTHFLEWKCYNFNQNSRKFVSKGPINKISAFGLWVGGDQATSHYLNQWWLDYRFIYASLGLNQLKRNCIPALVEIMAWPRPGDQPLSEPMMVSQQMHICVTQPQWVKVKWMFYSLNDYVIFSFNRLQNNISVFRAKPIYTCNQI